ATYAGLPGAGIQGMAFTADDRHLVAADSNALYGVALGGGAMFSKLIQDIHNGIALAPSSDFIAAMAPNGAEIDVYPINGGMPTIAVQNGGAADVALGALVGYEPTKNAPKLVYSGVSQSTGVPFLSFANAHGAPA